MKEAFIKIGIIGSGWITCKAHLPALQLNGHAKVTALYDLNTEIALKVASEFQISTVHVSLEDLLHSDIDAVIISTPNDTHADYSIRALKAGKHVLCEKPVALNTEEMDKVIKVAKLSNKIYLPAFVNRFRPDTRQLFDIISNGEIGAITSIEAGWIRRNGVPRPGTWFTSKKRSGGGVLIDLGSHIVDIALMLVKGATIRKVEAHRWKEADDLKAASWFGKSDDDLLQDVEESVVSQIQIEEDKEILISLSWNAPVPNDYTYFFVKGTKGEVRLKTLFGFSNHKLWEEGTLSIKKAGMTEKVIKEEGGYAEMAFGEMINYFIHQIRTEERDQFLTPQDGLQVVQMIEDMYDDTNQNPDLRSYAKRWKEMKRKHFI